MNWRTLTFTLTALLLVGSAQAQAQGIWRCGAEGRSFSDKPCDHGRALLLAAAPDPDTQAEAAAVAAREAAQLQLLRQQRLQREQEAPLAAGFHRAAPEAVATPAARHGRVKRSKRYPAAKAGTWPTAARAFRRGPD